MKDGLVWGAASVYERRMRNLILSCAALALVACGGAGNREAALAKTARYQGDKIQIFNAMKTATESKHQIASSDETTLTLITVGRWYTPEGLASTSGEQDLRNVPNQSINVKLTVKLLPEGDKWVVDVMPKFVRFEKGSPMPQELSPNDASLPGWAPGKVDQLALEIHQALAQYEVKAPSGNISPPAGEPAPTGDPAPTGEPAPTTPADPAAGSAAPSTP